MASFLFFISLFVIVYAYIGYPLILLIAMNFRSKESSAGSETDNTFAISIIIAVFNEASSIKQKLENTLALKYGGKQLHEAGVEIIVVSDSSTDETDDIVKSYASQGVTLLCLEERGGKEKAQQKGIEQAGGDILVFTDANAILEEDALENLAQYFHDSDVGAVSSTDVVKASAANEEGESGEGMYVRYEMWLRALESKFQTLVGLSGSCFAVRKELCDDFQTDIPSDFALLLSAIKRGYKGVHGSDVVCSYSAVLTEEQEFSRKVRTVLRGITALFACKEVLWIKDNVSFSWQIISHKLCRWLVPFFFVIATISALYIFGENVVCDLIVMVFILFYALSIIAFFNKEVREKLIFKVPFFFMVTNTAIAKAWLLYFLGQRRVQWSPSRRDS